MSLLQLFLLVCLILCFLSLHIYKLLSILPPPIQGPLAFLVAVYCSFKQSPAHSLILVNLIYICIVCLYEKKIQFIPNGLLKQWLSLGLLVLVNTTTPLLWHSGDVCLIFRKGILSGSPNGLQPPPGCPSIFIDYIRLTSFLIRIAYVH